MPRASSIRNAGIGLAAVAFVMLIVVLGWAIPPRAAVIGTDRLGPENGEAVSNYLARSKDSLRGEDSSVRWALLSFTTAITSDRIPEYAAGLRISEVEYHVWVDRVATPIIPVPVPAGDAVAVATVKTAAAQMGSTPTYDDRSTRVKNLVTARLEANCACVVAVVLQAPLAELRTIAAKPGARVVEALPADAAADVFAVAPLLPEQSVSADPTPDDGPVPDN